MNKKKYLRKLSRLLHKLPQEEREAALRYYREYFDEAGSENEQRIIEELGTPEKVAEEVLSSHAEGNGTTLAKKHGIGTLWAVIVAILAAPIALPLAITAIVLILMLVIVALALLVAFFAALLGVGLGGIVALFGFPTIFFSDFTVALCSVGAYLFAVAVCLVLFALSILLVRLTFRALSALIRKLGRKKEHE